MDQLSVRTRLTAWNVGVVALVVTLAGFSVRYLLQGSLRAAVEADLRRAGEAGARWFPTAHLPKPPQEAGPKPKPPDKPAPNAFGAPGPDRRPRVLDRTGRDYRPEGTVRPWEWNGFRAALDGKRSFTTITADGEPLLVYSVPGVRDGEVQGVIQCVESLAPVNRAMDQLTWTLLVLLPAGLLLAGVGGAFLTGRALRPVREIADAAGEIQAESLSARLPVRGKDEFASLTHVLNRMLERLESAFERQKRFTGDASHELRTPLATIKVASTLPREDRWDAAGCYTALANIEQAADRAGRVVEGLLLLARADSQTLAARHVEPASLDGAIHAAASAARQSLGAATPASIRIELPSGEPLSVAVDEDQLTQVFVNLFENALRHTPADGEVRVRAERQDGAVLVSVKDTGEGIAAEHLPHLTERFYRADAARTRKRGGSGLGLAICRSIVEAYGGTFQITSEVGRGTEVIFSLPTASSVNDQSQS